MSKMSKSNKLDFIFYKNTLRTFLKEDGIKLWLEPYTNELNGFELEPFKELTKKYSSKLEVDNEIVENLLEKLRVNSVVRFQAQQKFKESGIATFFITLSCPKTNAPSSSSTSISSSASCNNERSAKEFTVEVKYFYTTGLKLKEEISKKCHIPAKRLKTITNGIYIMEDDTLEMQKIKNMAYVLALELSAEEEKQVEENENEDKMKRTMRATELLLHDNDGMYNLQVTDQLGREVVMPMEERKALTMAMTLHEKGKCALKQKQLSLALLYFLGADQQFSKCTLEILDIVDNYGLLCLDVVWCYLLLQQVAALPDAERRLEVCEKQLIRSYGKDMERVNKVRGGSNQEQAIFLRLHILQGVLAFYKGEKEKSKKIFDKAEEELGRLKVDEKALLTMLEIGYSEVESRLALRFSGNHVERAIEHIIFKKQEKRRRKEEEKEERIRKKMVKMLGKTIDGKDIDHNLYKNLTNMGYKRGPVREALKLHNNDLNAALEYLNSNRDLEIESPELKRKGGMSEEFKVISQQSIDMLQSMGYSADVAKAALQHYGEDIERSVNHLLQSGGHVPSEWLKSLSISSKSVQETHTSVLNIDEADYKLIEEEIVKEMEGKNDEDYLNLLLDDDANLLYEFKAKLASLE